LEDKFILRTTIWLDKIPRRSIPSTRNSLQLKHNVFEVNSNVEHDHTKRSSQTANGPVPHLQLGSSSSVLFAHGSREGREGGREEERERAKKRGKVSEATAHYISNTHIIILLFKNAPSFLLFVSSLLSPLSSLQWLSPSPPPSLSSTPSPLVASQCWGLERFKRTRQVFLLLISSDQLFQWNDDTFPIG
jgi:hypothetical protein